MSIRISSNLIKGDFFQQPSLLAHQFGILQNVTLRSIITRFV